MKQWWRDLLFAHWPVEAGRIAPLLPAGLEVDTHEGQAWVGIVPFRMSGVRPRFLPAVPGLSDFPELNLRTYVVARGGERSRPGVYFWSLDATQPVAVAIARRFFHLAYRHAVMRCEQRGEWIEYSSRRREGEGRAAELFCRYRGTGPAPRTGLGEFLTSRYCLYTADAAGRLYRGEIDHAPWPLENAEADWGVNTIAAAAGITLPDCPPVLHFSRAIEVVIFPLERMG
ncbi:MAG: DUF2071 domain-containing protein [Bryobacter sp.]|jgi:hypothetical protein|nr:DUF2071 domain-containing protein [Bryobacter sp. CoA8 C33]